MKNKTSKYLGLGSNVGDRRTQLITAVSELNRRGISVTRSSSIYESEPIGCSDEAWFLNMVVEVETSLPPHTCLQVCQDIEKCMGRRRPYPNAPRTIDIDILLWNGQDIKDHILTVPHPRMHLRRFVIAPLEELGVVVSIENRNALEEQCVSRYA